MYWRGWLLWGIPLCNSYLRRNKQTNHRVCIAHSMTIDSINESTDDILDHSISPNKTESSLEKLLRIKNVRKKKKEFVGGYDMHTNETNLNETMLSQIAENMRKLKLLNLLENPHISEIEKLNRLENYTKTDSISGHYAILKKSGMVDLEQYSESTYGVDMTKGGLFSDWNNDVF